MNKMMKTITLIFSLLFFSTYAEDKKTIPSFIIEMKVDAKKRTIYKVDKKEITLVQLKEKIKKLKKETVIILRAAKDVPFKSEAGIIDAIKNAGITKIRIQADLDEKKKE